jgi:hypothetical protein
MFKIAFINLGVLLGILLTIETCSWSILSFRKEAQPFFVDPTVGFSRTLQAPDHFRQLRHLDPLLGWGYDPADIKEANTLQTEYAIFGAKDPRAVRIVLTGGSTTDSFHDGRKWPALLTEKLHNAGYCVRTYVGGVAAFNSSQEMLKIIRDQYELKPQIHISYSGVNEIESEWATLSSYYLFELADKMLNARHTFLLPNSVFLLGNFQGASQGRSSGVNRGLNQPLDRAERWNFNMRRMHAISKEFDYEFIAVLQPILGVGDYNPSAVERQRIKDMKLVEGWSDFYKKAQGYVKEKPYMYDFVDIFAGQSNLYHDDCHVNKVGEHVIAEKMFKVVTARFAKLLEKSKLKNCE